MTALTLEWLDALESDLRFGYRPDIQDCGRLIAAARAHLAAWQPIESAPKDGTRLIVYSQLWGRVLAYNDGGYDDDPGDWRLSQTLISIPGEITHWMPLPNPPNTNGERDGNESNKRDRSNPVHPGAAVRGNPDPVAAPAITEGEEDAAEFYERQREELLMDPHLPEPIPAGEEWQTIKTAPKDGTRILVYDGRTVLAAKWSARWRDWINLMGVWAVQPTHWRKFPVPPK
jgi:hypothetical protein